MSEQKFDFVFRYKLTRQEAYDAFYLLASRQSKKAKIFYFAGLTGISAYMLLLFALDSRKLHCLFLALIAVALLFYLLYRPVFCARKGAENVVRTNGTYQVELSASGLIRLPPDQVLKFGSDRYARFVETDYIFALRIDAQHTLCIPKRILKESEIDRIRDILCNARHKGP